MVIRFREIQDINSKRAKLFALCEETGLCAWMYRSTWRDLSDDKEKLVKVIDDAKADNGKITGK